MAETWVARKAHRAAWRTVAATAAALGVVLFILGRQDRVLRNAFKGPFEITAAACRRT